MNSLRTLAIYSVASLATIATAQNYYIPINLFPYANDRLQSRDVFFPEGNEVLGGVPFAIEPGVNNVWWAANAPGNNPKVLTVPANVEGVTEVHTLINTAWGVANAPSRLKIEFLGAGNVTLHSVELIGNVDIRDWNNFNFTNNINNTTTTQVWSGNNHRIDKQRFVMPQAVTGSDLRAIRIVDTGDTNVQRAYVQGITLVIDQPQARTWGPSLGGNCNAYNAYQTPDGTGWQNAANNAAALGSHLATISSAAENAFAYSLVGGNAAFWYTNQAGDGMGPWIGGRQAPSSNEPASGWNWVTGEDFYGFTNWAFGEPNNVNGGIEDRIHLFGSQLPRAGTWNDYPGAFNVRGYIVEFPFCAADYNADGGVDGTDVQVFFNDWSDSAGCSDVNSDGGIDGSDVQAFFDVWSRGGC